MTDERHTDSDHTYGVRGRVVQAPDCASGDAGSNPVAHPMLLRNYQLEAIERVRESFALPASLMRGSGPYIASPRGSSVLVERRAEDPSVAGSSPARGTILCDESNRVLKRKPKV